MSATMTTMVKAQIHPVRNVNSIPSAYLYPLRESRSSTQDIELHTMGSGERSQSTMHPLTSPASRSSKTENSQVSPPFEMTLMTERIYLGALCWCLFLAGWNDGTLGPLLLRIRGYYDINFAVVSSLFICKCVGFVSGAVGNVYLSQKLGFGKVLVLGACMQVFTYAVQAPAPPFPLMCTVEVVNGIGLALQNAHANAFTASIPRHQAINMGILHATYGLGAFAAPLAATQFSQMPRWSFHYLVSLGISLSNLVILVWVFRFKRQDYFLPETTSQAIPESDAAQGNQYQQILRQKVVHALAFFVFVYVGVEVTIGGWIVTYAINERGGGPSSGYISSGFFAGLTLGRVLLVWVNKKIGEWHVIYGYTALCIALEFTVWFVPNLIGNAVAVCIIGMLLGPFYPIAMNISGAILPRRLLSGSIGWIAGIGQAGSAVFPFMTGAMAQRYGIKVLQPLLVAMMFFMMMLWFLVTRFKFERRKE